MKTTTVVARATGLIGSLFLGAILAAAQPYNQPRPNYPGGRESAQPGGLWSNQALKYDRVFTRILKFAKESERIRNVAEGKELLDQVAQDAAFLQQKWRDWLTYNREEYQRGGRVDRYYEGLTQVQRLLEEAAREKDSAKALAKVRDAAFDLQTKAENCRNSADGLGKVVHVRVRTLSNTNEVFGYEVWFVQKGMVNVKAAHDRFFKVSSPTDELELAPGGYAFWTKKGKVLSEPVPLRVGGKGQQKIEIDLLVPEP